MTPNDKKNDKAFDTAESHAADRREEAKARAKFGDGKSDKAAIKETVKLWRDGTGSAVDKL